MGLRIIISETYKLPPEETLNTEKAWKDLLFNQKKIKYGYTNSMFSPEVVVKAIKDGTVKLKNARKFEFNTHAYEQLVSGTLIDFSSP